MNTKAHEIVTVVCHSQPVPLELAQAARDDVEALVEALEALLVEFDAYDQAMAQIGRGHEDYGQQRERARAAIAKAKGPTEAVVMALDTLVRRIERDNLHTTHGVKLDAARAALAKAKGEKE
jgi:hypothetical protein